VARGRIVPCPPTPRRPPPAPPKASAAANTVAEPVDKLEVFPEIFTSSQRNICCIMMNNYYCTFYHGTRNVFFLHRRNLGQS